MKSARVISAPQDRMRLPSKRQFRDPRSNFERFQENVSNKGTFLFWTVVMAASDLFVPDTSIFIFFVYFLFYMMAKSHIQKERMPMRMPFYANREDIGDPIPGSRKAGMSAGQFYVGNEHGTNKELWTKKEDELTHTMVFGSTGSGKTETLVGFAVMGFLHVSGFSYVDPKAAPKLGFQMAALSRFYMRDYDTRYLNYMTGNQNMSKKTPKRMSNTTNPFSRGNSDANANTLTSLITVSKGDNAVFGANAQNWMASAMRGAVERRDNLNMPLDVRVIRDLLSSAKYIEMANDLRLTQNTRDSMMSFLFSMGYKHGVEPEKQPPGFTQQYGYAIAYYSQPLNSLTDSYGYIYGATRGEVDRVDAIRERRIIIELLPSLEKAPAELANIGKVTLSAIKLAVGSGLGSSLEGSVAGVVDAAPLAGDMPYQIIVDEYAAIATEGFVQVLTQGRGIGIAAVIGSQDFDGLKHSSEVEANQATENTKLKLFMNMDIGGGTFDLLKKATMEMTVAKKGGEEIKEGDPGNWRSQNRTSYEKVDRVNLIDLQTQIEGEFHAVFRGQLVRGRSFYANPPLYKDFQLRIPRMVARPLVREEDVASLRQLDKTLMSELEGMHTKYKPTTQNVDQNFLRYQNFWKSWETVRTQNTEIMLRETLCACFVETMIINNEAVAIALNVVDRPDVTTQTPPASTQDIDGGYQGENTGQITIDTPPPVVDTAIVSGGSNGEGEDDEDDAFADIERDLKRREQAGPKGVGSTTTSDEDDFGTGAAAGESTESRQPVYRPRQAASSSILGMLSDIDIETGNDPSIMPDGMDASLFPELQSESQKSTDAMAEAVRRMGIPLAKTDEETQSVHRDAEEMSASLRTKTETSFAYPTDPIPKKISEEGAQGIRERMRSRVIKK